VTTKGEPKPPKKPTGARGAGKSTRPALPSRKKPKSTLRRPTLAEAIARNRKVVELRLMEHKTWRQIAEEVGVNEMTARTGYRTYVEEIAPLIDSEDAFEKAREFLLKLEGIQSKFAAVAAGSNHEMVKIAALRSLVDAMWKEVELRQHLGLLPSDLAGLADETEARWVAQQVVALLRKYGAPQKAITELHEIMRVPEPPRALSAV
jgi:hypothetical protein